MNLSKPFIINYSKKGMKKTIRLRKIFLYNLNSKKGSVFCYLRSLYIFTKNKYFCFFIQFNIPLLLSYFLP
ncbi:DUF226 domain-containing protein [Borreliella lusitaniae]|uniref:DUF226 domain-containing protein n=2 Tax=Borreliella lusitaniae TaxID=100177 RepID=UPI003C70E237